MSEPSGTDPIPSEASLDSWTDSSGALRSGTSVQRVADTSSSSVWLSRFRTVHPPVAARDHDPKFGPVFVRGLGARLWDVEGRDYIDLTCGYSAANFGQAFPPLVHAATRQLSQLTHVTGEPHVARIELAEQLLERFAFPSQASKVLFNVTGARAIETAWKAAVAYRPGKILTVGPCFHGRSIATLALGQAHVDGSPSCFHAQIEVGPQSEYPYCAACPHALAYPSCELRCVEPLFARIAQNSAELSAVLVEPAIGARGTIFPPAEFFTQLRKLTQRAGVLLIADEVQTGLGRCGAWSLATAQGWQPDLLVLGKSLGGGIAPISAVLGRAEVLDCLAAGTESETYCASPLATAIALEVLRQLSSGEWIARASKLGEAFRRFAEAEIDRHRLAGCLVEGIGACCVLEFGRIDVPNPRVDRARRFSEACARHRVLTHFTGPHLSRVAMLPPFTMSEQEQFDAFERLHAAFQEIA